MHSVGRQDDKYIERIKVLHEQRAMPDFENADDRFPGGGTVNQPGSQVRGDERPGNKGPAEFLKDHVCVGHAQPDTAVGFRQSQRKDAGVGEFAPTGPIDPPGFDMCTYDIGRKPAVAQTLHRRTQLNLKFVGFEVHGSAFLGKAEHTLGDYVALDL